MVSSTICLANALFPLLAIGQFMDDPDRIVLVPRPGDAIVIPGVTEVFDGTQQVATLAEGTTVRFIRRRDKKLYVSFRQDGKRTRGWVDESVLIAPRSRSVSYPKRPRTSAQAGDMPSLLGQWQEIYSEQNGQMAKFEQLKLITITDSKVIEQNPLRANRPTRPKQFSYLVDASETPKQFDLIRSVRGQLYSRAGIFTLKDDDTLIWCYPKTFTPTAENRPSEFVSQRGDGMVLVMLKRIVDYNAYEYHYYDNYYNEDSLVARLREDA